MPEPLGRVAALHRYPVKSMRGELLQTADLDGAGLDGDRAWALLDRMRNWASAKTNRERWRLVDGMLDLRATTDEQGVVVTLPDGTTARAGEPAADEALSAHLGRELRFDRGDRGYRWGRHHDAAPLHLVTTATLAALADDDGTPLDPLRLRPNVVLETPEGAPDFAEDAWPGRAFRLGGAVLRATERTERCVMTTRAQGDEVPEGRTVLKRIGQRNEACAGIYFAVVTPGRVSVGDELHPLDD
ncbi:MOSC domain-containing protein [Patulibacter sp. SYSU D01012]|uniref:MOSC domain-containing protein n=1 Tax=Patulibacter sp. SYSU D01012 TaxID=2817381 RepID=UPI001B312CC2|nr:MOSC domain-containing protein [Patulibacter sp. SYSU D01012]